jgi:hypothetical protein
MLKLSSGVTFGFALVAITAGAAQAGNTHSVSATPFTTTLPSITVLTDERSPVLCFDFDRDTEATGETLDSTMLQPLGWGRLLETPRDETRAA